MEQLRNTLRIPNSPQMVYEDFTPPSDWTHDSNCHVLLIHLPGFKREELKVRVDNMRKVIVSGERQVSENKFSQIKQMYEMPEDSDVDSISGRFDEGVLFIIIPKKKNDQVQHPKPEIQSADDIEQEEKYNKFNGRHDDNDHKHNHEKRNDQKREEPKKDEPVSKVHKQDDNSNYHLGNEKKEENVANEVKEVLREERRMMEENWRKLTEKVTNNQELKVLVKTTMETLNKNKSMIITVVVAFSIGLYISRKFQSSGQ